MGVEGGRDIWRVAWTLLLALLATNSLTVRTTDARISSATSQDEVFVKSETVDDATKQRNVYQPEKTLYKSRNNYSLSLSGDENVEFINVNRIENEILNKDDLNSVSSMNSVNNAITIPLNNNYGNNVRISNSEWSEHVNNISAISHNLYLSSHNSFEKQPHRKRRSVSSGSPGSFVDANFPPGNKSEKFNMRNSLFDSAHREVSSDALLFGYPQSSWGRSSLMSNRQAALQDDNNCRTDIRYPTFSNDTKTLLLGVLMTQIGTVRERLGLKIPGAVSYAVHYINDNNILPDDYKLQFEVTVAIIWVCLFRFIYF